MWCPTDMNNCFFSVSCIRVVGQHFLSCNECRKEGSEREHEFPSHIMGRVGSRGWISWLAFLFWANFFPEGMEIEGKYLLQWTADFSFPVILVHLAHRFLLFIFSLLYSKWLWPTKPCYRAPKTGCSQPPPHCFLETTTLCAHECLWKALRLLGLSNTATLFLHWVAVGRQWQKPLCHCDKN